MRHIHILFIVLFTVLHNLLLQLLLSHVFILIVVHFNHFIQILFLKWFEFLCKHPKLLSVRLLDIHDNFLLHFRNSPSPHTLRLSRCLRVFFINKRIWIRHLLHFFFRLLKNLRNLCNKLPNIIVKAAGADLVKDGASESLGLERPQLLYQVLDLN